VSEPELSLVPPEARPYQGKPAGIVTRTLANTIDGVLVGLLLLGGYGAWAAVVFLLAPRDLTLPDPSFVLIATEYGVLLTLYFTLAWSVGGRTPGDHVMGLRVTGGRRRLRLPRAFLRALACVVFPAGLLWCVVDVRRRSVQDLLLRTQVVHDWLPRPTGDGAPGSAPLGGGL
jgi:uncharacterized RDD family membrane protein YckC